LSRSAGTSFSGQTARGLSKDLRELRVVSRYRRKLGQSLAGEKNRLHKLLDDAGIKLGGVVSDIKGVCARKMVGTPAELAALGRGKLKRPSEVLEAAMDGDLSPRHRLVLSTVLNHLHYLEREVARLDRYLIEAKPYAWAWRLLQTIPGIDWRCEPPHVVADLDQDQRGADFDNSLQIDVGTIIVLMGASSAARSLMIHWPRDCSSVPGATTADSIALGRVRADVFLCPSLNLRHAHSGARFRLREGGTKNPTGRSAQGLS
jgi:hypothetical protein